MAMNTPPDISVIIPTHNRPDILKKTLQSIQNQTYKDFELIVVSNGFSQANKEILASFEDPRFFYVEQENSGGPASPRNHGIRRARGKWLAFCDDDDLWHPEKLEKQREALIKQGDAQLCYTKTECFDAQGVWQPLHPERTPDALSLLYENPVAISSVFVEKALVEKIGGFPEEKSVGPFEDYAFLLRCIRCTRFVLVDAYLTQYFSGEGRTTCLEEKRTAWDIIFDLTSYLACYEKIWKEGAFSLAELWKPAWYRVFFALKNIAKHILRKLCFV